LALTNFQQLLVLIFDLILELKQEALRWLHIFYKNLV